MGWAVYAGGVLLFIALASVFSPGPRGCGGCFDAWRSPRWCPCSGRRRGDYLVPAVIAALFEGIVKSGDAAAALEIFGISWGLALCVATFRPFLKSVGQARLALA